MTTKTLLERIRRRLFDVVGDDNVRLWKDKGLIDDYADDVQKDMCRRIPFLITDSSTVNEVLATGTITLDGSAGSIDSVKVNGITITSAAVPFNGNIEQTATDLAANINAHTSSPNYTAVAVGAVVTISAVAGTGYTPNGYAIVVTATTLTATVADISGGSALCRLYLVPGQSEYQTDPKILAFRRIKPTLQTMPLVKTTMAELDSKLAGWEALTGTPEMWVSDFGNDRIKVVRTPIVADTVLLTVGRLPLNDLTVDDLDASPEIPEQYHPFIIPGVLQMAFQEDESQTSRPDLATKYQAQYLKGIADIENDVLMTQTATYTSRASEAFRR